MTALLGIVEMGNKESEKKKSGSEKEKGNEERRGNEKKTKNTTEARQGEKRIQGGIIYKLSDHTIVLRL